MSTLHLLFFLLSSCTTFEPLTPMPPPPALEVGALVPGGPLRLRLAVGRPRTRVALLLSAHRAEPGACPLFLRGACLDLLDPRVVVDRRTDAAGQIEVTLPVPADLTPGAVIGLQAVAFLPGGPQPTAAVDALVLVPHEDLDRDGLDALTEAGLGLQPHLPDTDGGGTLDGQEVLADLTDPRDPRDDVPFEQDCDDDLDGDGDGARDCGDPDCGCPEQCGDQQDNDRDGLTDCADVDCVGQPACAEQCADRVDNDRDGRTDCADDDCAASPSCERLCADGLDDDGDGRVDCADADCTGLPGCPRSGEVCTDGVDNDGDRSIDCRDSACAALPVCLEACSNRVDDNANGAIDCADPNCNSPIRPSCAEDCQDGVDNNSDGLADGADPRCFNTQEICFNGRDDDGDGFIDCADYACASGCFERCDNGADDDGDGDADCADDACAAWCSEACSDLADNDGDGALDCQDADCEGRCQEICFNGLDDDLDLRADCADADCHCAEDCTNGTDDDRDGVTDCVDPDCGVACGEICDNGRDDDADGLADCEDGSCADACAEDCSNSIDDDGDPWVDCQDEDCWGEPACPPAASVAWVTGGALRARSWRAAGHLTSSCTMGGQRHSRGGDGTAEDVRGTLRVDHAGREALCTWQVERAVFSHVVYDTTVQHSSSTRTSMGGTELFWSCEEGVREAWDLQRTGFSIAPGCGVSTSGFLPDTLDPRGSSDGSPYSFGLPPNGPLEGDASARLPGGLVWYGGGVGVGSRVSRTQSGAAYRSSEIGRTGPLTPQAAYGTCEVGLPVLVVAPQRVGGWEGVCP